MNIYNDMSTAVIWSKSKRESDVEFQYGGHLGKFHGMSSQCHLPHCRVLPPGKFNGMSCQSQVSHCRVLPLSEFTVMIPEPHATLQGASHLAKSMSWSCHIAGCNNSIRYIENRFLPYFSFFNAVWVLTNGGFRIVHDTLVLFQNGTFGCILIHLWGHKKQSFPSHRISLGLYIIQREKGSRSTTCTLFVLSGPI